MTVTMYTDGACSVGRGGWAWWVDDHFWDYGAVDETTNNRMEMLAVVQGLHAMHSHRPGERLLIVSDSAYVVNCFADQWYVRWRANGWVNSSRKPVENRDLWEKMLELYEPHRDHIAFRHCRGHGKGGAGDAPYVAGNHQADLLAVAARKTLER